MFGKKKHSGKQPEKQDKKDKTEGGEIDISQENGTEEKHAAPRKAKSEMNDFFDISVPDNALEVFDTNKNYFAGDKRDGSAFYVGMLLHTEDIGGFSKKTKGNSDKGRIIEAIRGGNIDAYITPEQNENGELIFIPNEKTFDFIEEFSMLTDAEYEVAQVDTKTGEVTKNGIKASFAAFRKPLKDESALEDLIGKKGDNKVPELINTPPIYVSPPALPTEIPAAPELSNIPPVPTFATPAPPVADPPPPPPVVTVPSPKSDTKKEEPEDDTVYTEADVGKAISRTYYSEGLNLEVSSLPFEQIFVEGNKQILFDDKQKDGFVDGELNRMAKNANIEIRRFREKYMQSMREHFLTTVSEGAVQAQKRFDVHNPATDSGRQKSELDAARHEKIENIDAIVSEQKRLIEAEYVKQKQVLIEESARKAASEYNIKFGRLHMDKLENLPNKVRETIESEYNRDLREIYYERQDRALTSFDYMTTELLKVISAQMYVNFVKEEDALYSRHIAALEDYARTLHKEDARRTMIEEERLRIQRDVEEARGEMKERVKALTDSFEATERSRVLEHEAAVSLLQERNKALQSQMEERVAMLESDKQSLEESLKVSRGQFAHANDAAKDEYKSQIENANRNVEQWQTMVTSLEKQYKHYNKLSVIIMVAVVIAAIAIGFVVGGIWYKNNDDAVPQNQIITSETSPQTLPGELPMTSPQTLPGEVPEMLPETSPQTLPGTLPEKTPETRPAIPSEKQPRE